MAMTSDAFRRFRITRPLGPTGISRALECLIEFAFQHGLQEFPGSVPKPSFNGIEPVVEKMRRSLGFRLRLLRHRAKACHGVISAGFGRNRLLDQAGDYAAFNFQPLPLRHRFPKAVPSDLWPNSILLRPRILTLMSRIMLSVPAHRVCPGFFRPPSAAFQGHEL